jgi:PST family polysaccharide transporter
VLLAIVLNYAAMSSLSIATTGLSWGRFLAAHVRGAALAGVTAVVALLAVRFLRTAGASDLVILVGSSGLVAAILGAGALTSPGLVLGPDGLWLMQKVRSMGAPRGARRLPKAAPAGAVEG